MQFEKTIATFEEKIAFIQSRKIEEIFNKLMLDDEDINDCLDLTRLEVPLEAFSKQIANSLRKFFSAFMKQTSKGTMSRKCFYLNMVAAAEQNKFEIPSMLLDQDILEMQQILKILKLKHLSPSGGSKNNSSFYGNISQHQIRDLEQLSLKLDIKCGSSQQEQEKTENELPTHLDRDSHIRISLTKEQIGEEEYDQDDFLKTAQFSNEFLDQNNYFYENTNILAQEQHEQQYQQQCQSPAPSTAHPILSQHSQKQSTNSKLSMHCSLERSIQNEQQIQPLRGGKNIQNINNLKKVEKQQQRIKQGHQKQLEYSFNERMQFNQGLLAKHNFITGKENFSRDLLELEDTLISRIQKDENTLRKVKAHPQQEKKKQEQQSIPNIQYNLSQKKITNRQSHHQHEFDSKSKQASIQSRKSWNQRSLQANCSTQSLSPKPKNKQKGESHSVDKTSSMRDISRSVSPNSRLGMRVQMQNQRNAISDIKPLKYPDFQQQMLQRAKDSRTHLFNNKIGIISLSNNSKKKITSQNQELLVNNQNVIKSKQLKAQTETEGESGRKQRRNSIIPQRQVHTLSSQKKLSYSSYSTQFKKKKEIYGQKQFQKQSINNYPSNNQTQENSKQKHEQQQMPRSPFDQSDSISIDSIAYLNQYQNIISNNQNASSMEVSQRHVVSCYDDDEDKKESSLTNPMNSSFDQNCQECSTRNNQRQLNSQFNTKISENSLKSQQNLENPVSLEELKAISVGSCSTLSRDGFIDDLSRNLVDAENQELFRAQLENLRKIQIEKQKLIDEEHLMLRELQISAAEYQLLSSQAGEPKTEQTQQEQFQKQRNIISSSFNSFFH